MEKSSSPTAYAVKPNSSSRTAAKENKNVFWQKNNNTNLSNNRGKHIFETSPNLELTILMS